MIEEDQAPDEVPAQKSGKRVVIGVVVLNLCITGFIGFRLTRPASGNSALKQKVAIAEGAGLRRPNDALVETFDPFVVNLNEEESTRYLKLTFELEMVDTAARADVQKMKRVLRDNLLRYLSSLTVKDTVSEFSKNKIADTIINRTHEVIGPSRVRRLFFGEFVVQ